MGTHKLSSRTMDVAGVALAAQAMAESAADTKLGGLFMPAASA